MNAPKKDLRNIETIHPGNEPAVSSGTGADGDEPARDGGESLAAAGKSHGFRRPMFVIAGVALSMGLTSCVLPYDSYGDGSVTVSSYRPGYTVSSLPRGYRSETISGRTYYYHDGYYYRPGSSGYVVVEAPRSSRYYDDYSRRLQSHQTNRNYRKSDRRNDRKHDRGEYISRLPDGYRELSYRGDTYYQSGNRYYRRQGDRYVVSTRPY